MADENLIATDTTDTTDTSDMTENVTDAVEQTTAEAAASAVVEDLTQEEIVEMAAEVAVGGVEAIPPSPEDALHPTDQPAAEALIHEIDAAVIAGLENTSQKLRRANLDANTAEVLTRIYLTKRIHYQMDWYKSRMIENDYNDGTMFKLAAWVMSISSVLAMGGAVSDSALLPMLTALLPPVAALITSFRSLYQWDKQNSVYHDTVLGLEEAKLVLPDFDEVDMNIAFTVYPQLVRTAESAFEKEAQQWGQIASGKTEDGANMDAVERFANEFGLTILDDDGYINEDKIAEIRAILQASEQPKRAQRRPGTETDAASDAALAPAPAPDELG